MRKTWKSPYSARMPGRVRLHHHRVAAVSYLNAKPLLVGLDDIPEIELTKAIPSEMRTMLSDSRADAALLPSIDIQRFHGDLTVLPAGCISSSGTTLTVRIFSQVRPVRITTLWADTDSHTSVALAQVLWYMQFKRRLRIIPFTPGKFDPAEDAQAVLMIGDKVVADPPIGYDFQFDLGRMWFEMTGLPFTFAVWAATAGSHMDELYRVLSAARRDGTENLHELAHTYAEQYGWPLDLAERYYTKCLQYEFTDAHREGLTEFYEMAADVGILDEVRPLNYYRP